jgi:hypothetical protein
MFFYNLSHFFQIVQKLFQIWISKKISKEKKNNKLKKEKANLFLETWITKAKCLQISIALSISFTPLSTSTTSL